MGVSDMKNRKKCRLTALGLCGAVMASVCAQFPAAPQREIRLLPQPPTESVSPIAAASSGRTPEAEYNRAAC